MNERRITVFTKARTCIESNTEWPKWYLSLLIRCMIVRYRENDNCFRHWASPGRLRGLFPFFAPLAMEVDRKPAREEKLITSTFRPYSAFPRARFKTVSQAFRRYDFQFKGESGSPILRRGLTERSFLKASNYDERESRAREESEKKSKLLFTASSCSFDRVVLQTVDTIRPPATVSYSNMDVTYNFMDLLLLSTQILSIFSDKSSLIKCQTFNVQYTTTISQFYCSLYAN